MLNNQNNASIEDSYLNNLIKIKSWYNDKYDN